METSSQTVDVFAHSKVMRERSNGVERPLVADQIDVWNAVYVQLEDDVVTIYSGAPGGHTTKGTKIAKKSCHVRGAAGVLNLECGESGAARRFGCVWSCKPSAYLRMLFTL